MSLELIDRFLANWEDPDYEGMTEQMTYLRHIENSIDVDINEKLVRDIEQVRYLKPSLTKMSEYPRSREGLIKFYKDHNFIPGHPKEVKQAYRMMPFPEQYELDQISKYLNDDTKYIMQIAFAEGLLALHFLENTKAYLVTFAFFKYEYGFYGKMFLENMYPGRHILNFGIPKLTIPSFSLGKEPHIKFDVICYGGSRRYYDVYNILLDCRQYAHEDTTIILLYVCPHLGLGTGPYIGMLKLLQDGIVNFVEHVKTPGPYGEYTNGFAVLKYNMKSQNISTQNTNKLPTKVYKSIEINIPLYEFTNFIIDNHKKEIKIEPDLIKLYIKKLNNAGIELDDYLKKYILDNYGIN